MLSQEISPAMRLLRIQIRRERKNSANWLILHRTVDNFQTVWIFRRCSLKLWGRSLRIAQVAAVERAGAPTVTTPLIWPIIWTPTAIPHPLQYPAIPHQYLPRCCMVSYLATITRRGQLCQPVLLSVCKASSGVASPIPYYFLFQNMVV